MEIINDLDGEIVNLFQVIRDYPKQLERAVALTPYSRGEYDRCMDRISSGEKMDPVELARVTLVRYWQSFAGTPSRDSSWKRDSGGREYAYTVRNWIRLPGWISDAVDRLKTAQIECQPAVEVIRNNRRGDTLIYADPPYLLSTRRKKQYTREMDDAGHEQLLKALLAHPAR